MAEEIGQKEENGKLQEHEARILVDVQNLKKYFPVRAGLLQRVVAWVKAVDDVSFHIYDGESFGLVGESGCGKTTVGRTILHLIPPTDGKVYFDGQEIFELGDSDLLELRGKEESRRANENMRGGYIIGSYSHQLIGTEISLIGSTHKPTQWLKMEPGNFIFQKRSYTVFQSHIRHQMGSYSSMAR